MFSNIKNRLSKSSDNIVIIKIIKALKKLIDVFEKENIALKQGQVSDINIVIEEKILAIEEFTTAQIDIEGFLQKGGIFNKESVIMKKLEQLFIKLDQVRAQNEILVRSNLEVSNIITQIYKDNKMKEAVSKYGYDENGKVSVEKAQNIATCFSLNNRV